MSTAITSLTTAREHELVAFRRRLHANPEPSYAEHATTQAIAEPRMCPAGVNWRMAPLPNGNGCPKGISRIFVPLGVRAFSSRAVGGLARISSCGAR